MSLISNLKKEHEVILNAFSDVESLGASTLEGKKKLLKIKELLLSHLHKEDEIIYPKLEEIITSKSLSLTFRSDMKCVSKRALDLICRCEKLKAEESPESMDSEFMAVHKELKARIKREEDLLYPEYSRLTGDKP